MRSNRFLKSCAICAALVLIICGGAALYLLNRAEPPPVIISPPPEPSQTPVSEPPAPVSSLSDHPSPSPSQTPAPTTEPTPVVITENPVRIRIPVLEVDAEIQDTGVEKSGRMEVVPSASVISWLRDSAIPGNEGNSILAGHNKWSGKIGQLIDMDIMQVGDEMEIEYANGQTHKFYLESVFVYALDTIPGKIIMADGGPARVTMITCKGPYNAAIGTSENRIIAIFKTEEDFVYPDPPVTPFPTLDVSAPA